MERTGGGSVNYAIASQGTGAATAWVSDYNDLYNTTPANIGFWNATGYDFTNWQINSGGDANSISVAPIFTSMTDLHLTVANTGLDNKGTPILSINTDFDGDARNFITPDMGADEFTTGCSTLVTNTNDSGAGSLRDIILCAPSGATITFDPSLMNQSIILIGGEIVINKGIRLDGLGTNALTISGNNTSRIFNLLAGNDLIIENLTMENAVEVISGGAILVAGDLMLKNVNLQNNTENGVSKSLTLISTGTLTAIGNVNLNE